jgi:hypothetical protein
MLKLSKECQFGVIRERKAALLAHIVSKVAIYAGQMLKLKLGVLRALIYPNIWDQR